MGEDESKATEDLSAWTGGQVLFSHLEEVRGDIISTHFIDRKWGLKKTP